MKKFINKLKNITANFFVGALVGWFAFAISFDIMACILYAFFPETWSDVVYHMNQFLGF
jgi:hypothetical protein